MKTRCRQCRKRLTLPAGSEIEFCSGDCRGRYARRHGAPYHWPQFPGRPCLYCGGGVIRYGVSCGSEVCAKSNQLYLDAYRRTGGRIERVDFRQIVAKSNGRCGICGDDLNGAESVDHIFPLAHGGDHTLSNVQLAHPSCNTAKGDTVPAVTA
ncbi:HNH endonuclease signature motif containing protein [Streptomyces caelestis]|uniref:HNH endonuclease n=1 Tax=Streptomyces caelestis TaxID=36816 RepID=UPI003450FE93